MATTAQIREVLAPVIAGSDLEEQVMEAIASLPDEIKQGFSQEEVDSKISEALAQEKDNWRKRFWANQPIDGVEDVITDPAPVNNKPVSPFELTIDDVFPEED